jgi:hypothetical protein
LIGRILANRTICVTRQTKESSAALAPKSSAADEIIRIGPGSDLIGTKSNLP